MHCFRQAASRLLLSSSRVAIPRSSPSSALRLTLANRPVQSQLQSRWNSDDAQNKPVAPEAKEETSNESILEAVAQYAEQKENAAQQAAEQVAEEVKHTPAQAAEDVVAEQAAEEYLDQAVDRRPRRYTERGQETLDQLSDRKPRRGYGNSFTSEPEPKTTVFLGNLFYDVTAEDLKNHFAQFGEVRRVNLIMDGRGISKGFGYLDFDSIESAQRAIEEMHMRIYEGRRISVMYAQTKMRRPISSPPSKSLYIGNMPFEMTDRDLNDLFSDIPGVIDVRVAIDRRTGQPRGFAHADFVDLEHSREAKEILMNKNPYGRKLRVDYSSKHKGINDPKGEKTENSEVPLDQE